MLHFLVFGWDREIVIPENYSACGLYDVFAAMYGVVGGGHGASPTVSYREIRCARNDAVFLLSKSGIKQGSEA